MLCLFSRLISSKYVHETEFILICNIARLFQCDCTNAPQSPLGWKWGLQDLQDFWAYGAQRWPDKRGIYCHVTCGWIMEQRHTQTSYQMNVGVKWMLKKNQHFHYAATPEINNLTLKNKAMAFQYILKDIWLMVLLSCDHMRSRGQNHKLLVYYQWVFNLAVFDLHQTFPLCHFCYIFIFRMNRKTDFVIYCFFKTTFFYFFH